MNDITLLSSPAAVNMADAWFDLATADHFWMRRRFEVFQKLIRPFKLQGAAIAEIGCGAGVVIQQFVESYGSTIDGFDLNIRALQDARTRCPQARLFCYDIHERKQELKQRYDWLILFDVLEHLEDPEAFLQSSLFHLKKGGRIAINVPAAPWLFSRYDSAAGHLRRYTASTLRKLITIVGLNVVNLSYWGAPFLPILAVRKYMLKLVQDDRVIRTGFAPPSQLGNQLGEVLGQCEWIPQKIAGASVMAIASNV